MQYRVWAGPLYKPYGDTYYYDWTQHNVGGSFGTPSGLSLSATLSSGATSATLGGSIASWPSAGGVWIGPNGSGQAWEYCSYTKGAGSTINLVREPTLNREHNGIHTSGATVLRWLELTAVTRVTTNRNLNEELNTITWDIELEGVKFRQAALRNHHLCVIEQKPQGGSWIIYAVGWLETPRVKDDGKKQRAWSARVVTLNTLMDRTPIDGVRAGPFDIGRGASVTASDTLGAAWKERASGDYVAASPDFSGDSTTDGDTSTCWFGERYLGTEPTVAINNDPMVIQSGGGVTLIISEIHIALPAGQPDGYRWLEIRNIGVSAIVDGVALYVLASTDANDTISFSGLSLPVGGTIIVCEDQERFQEENPTANPNVIYNLPSHGHSNFLKNCALTGGALGLHRPASVLGAQVWLHVVAWGTGTQCAAMLDGVTTFYSPTFSGTSVTAPTASQTMRYNFANSATARNNWTLDLMHTPGYAMNDGKKSWLMLELPALNLSLKAGISSGYTGAVSVWNGSALSTVGLPSSGTIQIGSEQISYNTRTLTTINLTARGANSTSEAAHVAGDAIYIVDGGVAVDAHLIKSFVLEHKSIYATAGTVRTRKIDYQPRDPSDSGYTGDYDASQAWTGASTTIIVTLSASRRARWMLLEIDSMSVNPARPRLHNWQIVIDDATFDSNLYLTSGSNAGQLAARIASNEGIPASAVSSSAAVTLPDGFVPARATAWGMLQALALYANLIISIGLDSKITVTGNTFWFASVYSPGATWTRVNASRVEIVLNTAKAIGQVIVNWKNGGNSGSESYPATLADGELSEFDEQLIVDAASAQQSARTRYYLSRYPYVVVIEVVGTASLPGAIVTMQWQVDNTMQAMDRDYVVQQLREEWEATKHGVTHNSVMTLIEIGRENP